MSRTAIVAFVLTLAVAGDAAHARDMTGRFGIGGQVDTRLVEGEPPTVALSLKYWVSDFGLQVLFSIHPVPNLVEETADTTEPPIEGGEGGDPATDEAEPTGTHLEYSPALRLLYAMTRARATNLYIGVGISGRFPKSDQEKSGTAFFEAMLGAEHFFSKEFAISGHVTLSIEVASDPMRTLDTPGWGGSFHYYF